MHVLSAQSAVVHGFVGNRVAFPALFAHQVACDTLPTVQLSNHTGYRWVEPLTARAAAAGARDGDGTRLSADAQKRADLLRVFEDGLVRNGLASGYTHVLSGYVGSVGGLEAICEIVKRLRSGVAKANTDVLFVCDPVMGDHGKLYVSEALVPVYKELAVPLADAMFPNQTEVQLLTGLQVRNESDALAAIDVLHARGVGTVIITSSDLDPLDETPADIPFGSNDDSGASASASASASSLDLSPGMACENDGSHAAAATDSSSKHSRILDHFITLIGSYRGGDGRRSLVLPSGVQPDCRWRMRVPKFAQAFTGTGDLFSALILAWTARGHTIIDACEKTINAIYAIVRVTFEAKSSELLLMPAFSNVTEPPQTLKAELIRD